MQENENIEFKREYTDNIYKEIIAFLNSSSGTIYVGYSDEGHLIGLENSKEIEEKISNGITQKIVPDCSIFVSISNEILDEKGYIRIDVSKGTNIYSLKEKGILKGTFVRNGSCSMPASEETVKQMIIKNSNLSFETSVSLNQDLTFNYIAPAFSENNININDINIRKNLHLLNKENNFTNLALLLSDQNPFTIKVATYKSEEKSYFLDRKEFCGSLLKIYDDVISYLMLNSATYGLISSSIREDIEEYPEFILREITLNSIVHRDYSSITSNIINIYKNSCMEFISYGSLYGNITLDDALAGLSTSRNPYLQAVFMRLKRVEAIGSGLRRVNSYYKDKNLKLYLNALPSSFIVKLPRIGLKSGEKSLKSDVEIIKNYLNDHKDINRKTAESLIKKEKTTTASLLNEMVSDNILIKEGSGPNTRYTLR